MKILKKVGVVEKRREEETKSMPHAPVTSLARSLMGQAINQYECSDITKTRS